MTAILNQDLLFKLGIRAYLIQGNPFNYEFNDCHWFLMIYSKKDNRLFYYDPVWLTFVKDEYGNYLDVFQVRKNISIRKKI